ncbi:hypothetical protein ACSXEW_03505 [Clostridium perfringens]|uniref:hypothetical protein n=1 Tax=Clostridium perfringens TaxID=1502 RepID=UPI001A9BD5DC|nr:hypothetical protein [Clostridium perfringens]EGT3606058.1 hypothetical protein [Clostridium perfringens]
MYITITLKINEKDYDLKVDKRQTIIEFLKIINESLNLNININEINFVKSITHKKQISTYFTFEESEIFTGDILEIS